MEVLKIFDPKFQQIIQKGVTRVLLESQETDDVDQSLAKPPEKSTSLGCSYCRTEFETLTQQRDHYKLDWHRYNLRQSLLQKPPLSEEEFDEKTTKDDISSISGSDSEKEDSLDTYATSQGKVFLQTYESKVFSIYAGLIFDKKQDLSNNQLSNRIRNCTINNQQWAVLMLGGGHFAGAIFNKDTPILHKTFHCYTVRAGQGGAQSSRDNKSGGSQPKSAGASLRRYNEQALVQHVRGIVEAWRNELNRCGLIFYRAAGPYNRSVLFGGGNPLFERDDDRLRSVPFSTRRATFTEVKRVHSVLTMAHVYSSLESAVENFSLKVTKPKVKIDRAKSREIIERPLPVMQISESSDDEEVELITENETISFDLQEFEDTLTPEQRKKKKKPKKSKAKKLKEADELRKKQLVEILSKGCVDQLTNLLDCLKIEDKVDFLNEVLDNHGNTLLHIAALNEQTETLNFLLKNDANPCLKNQNHQTPYTCTSSKEIRAALKQFAQENPEKHNYNKAQIPTNVLTPEELSEKKKAQRKVKKEKEKIKRQENEIKRKEDAEKERFLKLSDREKRALAAERRIVNRAGFVIRCFLCGLDISGKVPFEYLGNRFCTVDCLKAHRMQNPVVLS